MSPCITRKTRSSTRRDVAIVEEGDSFSWNACVPHIVRNIGEETALLLISSHAENRKRVY